MYESLTNKRRKGGSEGRGEVVWLGEGIKTWKVEVEVTRCPHVCKTRVSNEGTRTPDCPHYDRLTRDSHPRDPTPSRDSRSPSYSLPRRTSRL